MILNIYCFNFTCLNVFCICYVIYRLSWQQEVGLIKREELRWVPKKPNCEGGQGFVSVGINEIKPALYLLVAGHSIAVLLAISENVFRFFYTRDQKAEINLSLKEYTPQSKNSFFRSFQKYSQYFGSRKIQLANNS